uniref:RDD family protein n=1 Tax=Roseihalotalea indica TaxID=2867963 RepID=A0AA49GR46_9BACT|nr:RDD family protein [Tunicatimonas sp. TK19036]
MIRETVLGRRKLDLLPFQIDDAIQASQLASFTRRASAFAIDWVIVILCTKQLSLLLPLLLIFWIVRGRMKSTLRKGQRMVKRNILLADRHLSAYDINTNLRRRFTRHMVVYLYILMYLPIVLAVGWLIIGIVRLISPEQYGTIGEQVNQLFDVAFQPINSLNDAFHLAIRFLGAILYFALFTWQWQGQTPGKRMLHVKAAKINGKPFTFWSSLERSTGYASSAAFFLFGFFQYFWDRNRQTTHDKIAETVVIEI